MTPEELAGIRARAHDETISGGAFARADLVVSRSDVRALLSEVGRLRDELDRTSHVIDRLATKIAELRQGRGRYPEEQ